VAHLSEVQGIYQLAISGNQADWTRKPEFSPTSQATDAILDALGGRHEDGPRRGSDVGERAEEGSASASGG
jgi:hypothetical protein